MATKIKKAAEPNYSVEAVEYIEANYVPGDSESVKAIADHLKRSTRQIIAKLVHLKMYQAPDKTAPVGGVVDGPSKKELLAKVAAVPEFADVTDGFAGATKVALQRLIDHFEPQASAE